MASMSLSRVCEGVQLDVKSERKLATFRSRFARIVRPLRERLQAHTNEGDDEDLQHNHSVDLEGLSTEDLERLLNKYANLQAQTDISKGKQEVDECAAEAGIDTKVQSVLQEIRPWVPEIVYRRLVLHCGHTLAHLQQFDTAIKVCYDDVIRHVGETPEPSDESTSLHARAEFGRARCLHSLVLRIDPDLLHRDNVEKAIHALDVALQEMQLLVNLPTSECERCCWLVYNGTIHMVYMSKALVDRGYIEDALPYLKYCLICMEAMLPLLAPSYLWWRLTIYEIITNCYLDQGLFESADKCITRSQEKLDELEKWQHSDPPVPAEVLESLESAKVRIQAMKQRCQYASGAIGVQVLASEDTIVHLKALKDILFNPSTKQSTDEVRSRFEASLEAAADIMKPHFDEVEAALNPPADPEAEAIAATARDDQENHQNVTVEPNLPPDTSFINDRVPVDIHIELMEKAVSWKMWSSATRLFAFVKWRRQHVPEAFIGRLDSVELVLLLGESEDISKLDRVGELAQSLLDRYRPTLKQDLHDSLLHDEDIIREGSDTEQDFPLQDALCHVLFPFFQKVVSPFLSSQETPRFQTTTSSSTSHRSSIAHSPEEQELTKHLSHLSSLYILWSRLHVHDALHIGRIALELCRVLDIELSASVSACALRCVHMYRSDAVKRLAPNHSIAADVFDPIPSRMYKAVLCVHVDLLVCWARARLDAVAGDRKNRRALEESMLGCRTHNRVERALLMVLFARHRNDIRAKQRMVEQAIELLEKEEHMIETLIPEQRELQSNATNATSSRSLLPPPALMWITPREVSLWPLPSGSSSVSVRVFGKAAITGSNVSINDAKLRGLGVDGAADQPILVEFLEPNTPYVFASQLSPSSVVDSSTGSNPMGIHTRTPVPSCFPLPVPLCWSYICIQASQMQLDECSRICGLKASDSIIGEDGESPWPQPWLGRIRFLGWRDVQINLAPASLIRALIHVQHVLVDTMTIPQRLNQSSTHIKALTPAERFVVRQGRSLLLGLELANSIDATDLAAELVLRLHRTLQPLLCSRQPRLLLIQLLWPAIEHAHQMKLRHANVAVKAVLPRLAHSLVQACSQIGSDGFDELDLEVLASTCSGDDVPEASAFRTVLRRNPHLSSKLDSMEVDKAILGVLGDDTALRASITTVNNATAGGTKKMLPVLLLEAVRRGLFQDIKTSWLPPDEELDIGALKDDPEACRRAAFLEMIRACCELDKDEEPSERSEAFLLGWEWEEARNVCVEDVAANSAIDIAEGGDASEAQATTMVLSETFWKAILSSLRCAKQGQAWQQLQNTLRLLMNTLQNLGKSPAELSGKHELLVEAASISLDMIEEFREIHSKREQERQRLEDQHGHDVDAGEAVSPEDVQIDENDPDETVEPEAVEDKKENVAEQNGDVAEEEVPTEDPICRSPGLHLSRGLRYSSKHELASTPDWCWWLWMTQEAWMDAELVYGVVRWAIMALFSRRQWRTLVELGDRTDGLTDAVYAVRHLHYILHAQNELVAASDAKMKGTKALLNGLDADFNKEKEESAKRRALRRSRLGKKEEDDRLAGIEKVYLEKRAHVQSEHDANIEDDKNERDRSSRLHDLHEDLTRDRSVCLKRIQQSRHHLFVYLNDTGVDAGKAISSYKRTIDLCRTKRETTLTCQSLAELGDLYMMCSRENESIKCWDGIVDAVFGALHASRASFNTMTLRIALSEGLLASPPSSGKISSEIAMEALGIWNCFAGSLALAKLGRLAYVSDVDHRWSCASLACSLSFAILSGTVGHPLTPSQLCLHQLDAVDGIFVGVDAFAATAPHRCKLGAGAVFAMQFAADEALQRRRPVASLAPLLILDAVARRSRQISLHIRSSSALVRSCIEAGRPAAAIARLHILLNRRDLPLSYNERRRRPSDAHKDVRWRDHLMVDDPHNVGVAQLTLDTTIPEKDKADELFAGQSCAVRLARAVCLAFLGRFDSDDVYISCAKSAESSLRELYTDKDVDRDVRVEASFQLITLLYHQARLQDALVCADSCIEMLKGLDVPDEAEENKHAAMNKGYVEVSMFQQLLMWKARLLYDQAHLEACELVCGAAAQAAKSVHCTRTKYMVTAIRADALAFEGKLKQARKHLESLHEERVQEDRKQSAPGSDQICEEERYLLGGIGWFSHIGVLEGLDEVAEAVRMCSRAIDFTIEMLADFGVDLSTEWNWSKRSPEEGVAPAVSRYLPQIPDLIRLFAYRSILLLQLNHGRSTSESIASANTALVVCQRLPELDPTLKAEVLLSKSMAESCVDSARAAVNLRRRFDHVHVLVKEAVLQLASAERETQLKALALLTAGRVQTMKREMVALAEQKESAAMMPKDASKTDLEKRQEHVIRAQVIEARMVARAKSLREWTHLYGNDPDDEQKVVERATKEAGEEVDITIREMLLFVVALHKEEAASYRRDHIRSRLIRFAHAWLCRALPSYKQRCCLSQSEDEADVIEQSLPKGMLVMHWIRVPGADQHQRCRLEAACCVESADDLIVVEKHMSRSAVFDVYAAAGKCRIRLQRNEEYSDRLEPEEKAENTRQAQAFMEQAFALISSMFKAPEAKPLYLTDFNVNIEFARRVQRLFDAEASEPFIDEAFAAAMHPMLSHYAQS